MKRYGIIDRISSPADLRTMSYDSLNELCAALREFIVDNVSRTGGHLASNLGIVELSVALEREFDSFQDRIIYDVGHQSYVHKILTDRREQFESLRTFGGISGFMKPEESPSDPCITGHASNSVSIALGMAHARTLKNQKYHVVAVIGDGALTGGMVYEALNNAGVSHEPLMVVLNDNKMSITHNVGGLSRHLSRLRVHPRYLRVKADVKGFLDKIPGGRAIHRGITRFKNRLKGLLLPTSLFEQMGFSYLGPVDGHDLKSICEMLSQAKKLKKPVLIHVVTRKGKGYAPSEKNPEQYHGVSKFDPITGMPLTPPAPDFSSAFGEELCALAKNDSRICAITAAMSSGTGLTNFAAQFSERFFDVGIAEEHAVSMAAGMAKQGLVPVLAVYSTFLQRGYDQLIHDVAIDGKIHLVVCIDRAGIVGADGATHNGTFDVSFVRSIPGFRLYAPSNFQELRTMLSRALYHDSGPVAIRYPRGGEGAFVLNMASGAACCLKEGEKVALISYGTLINHAIAAADILQESAINAAIYKINDLAAEPDSELLDAISHYDTILVAEDVVERGGYGEALSSALAESEFPVPHIILCNTGDRFLPHGTVPELYQYCGLDADSLAARILEAI